MDIDKKIENQAEIIERLQKKFLWYFNTSGISDGELQKDVCQAIESATSSLKMLIHIKMYVDKQTKI